jgi:hypothetical protein
VEPGRPVGVRFRRARRIAACTALAVSAGMLLAVPAAADDSVPPPAPVEQTRPSIEQPKLTLPKHGAKQHSAADAADVPVAKPRGDIDGDGFTDLLYRAGNGRIYVAPTSGTTSYEYLFDTSETANETFKDVFSVAGLEAAGPVHFTLLSSGRLSAYRSSPDHGTIIWSGVGWQAYNKVFSPGDLTGDGSGDILARTPSGDLYLYRTTPGAAAPMAARVKVGSGWGAYDQLIGVNDVNSDAIADLFARTPGGELFFYSGNPNPDSPFKGRVKVGNGWNGYNQILSLDDQSGDGLGDLVARTPSGLLYTYESTGTGAFLPRVAGGSGWNAVAQFAGAGNNPHLGKDEVLGLDTNGTLFTYYALNNGLLSARYQVGVVGGWKGAKLTFASSLDSNGWGDILELYNGTLYNHSYPSDQAAVIGSGWGVYNLLTGPGDLNGDGKGDLLARDGSGALYLYRGDGTGSKFAARLKVGTGWNGFNKLLGAGDVNGDGRSDLIARGTDGRLYLYAGTGAGSAPFKARTLIGSGWNTYTKLSAPGDLDGDGRADLVGANAAGELYRYTAKATGGFNTKAKIGNGWNTYSNLY